MTDPTETAVRQPLSPRRRRGPGAGARAAAGRISSAARRRISATSAKTYNCGQANAVHGDSRRELRRGRPAEQGRVRLHPRAQRLRQEHDPAAHRRARAAASAHDRRRARVRQARDRPGADRGMVFQDYTSFDNRTVLDNIAFGLECQGVSRRERYELARHWIEQAGLNVATDSTNIRTSCPAACGSAWRSPARSSCGRGSF